MKPYSTHSRTLPNNVKIDVFKLIGFVKNKKPETYKISEIKGLSRNKKKGFSEKRLATVSYQYPIIIDETGFLLDGRHRIIKAIEEGKTEIPVVVANKGEVDKARYELEENLTPYSSLVTPRDK